MNHQPGWTVQVPAAVLIASTPTVMQPTPPAPPTVAEMLTVRPPTYGPDLGASVVKLLGVAARRKFVDVYLYDKTGKRLLWKDEQGTTFLHVWADELNGVVGCVKQKCPATHFRPCDRRWYDPSQLGPDGKLKKGIEKEN